MDVFVLPQKYEGLAIVALESQAAGVPVLASTATPHDVDVISCLIERISLSDPPSCWASAVIRKLNEGKPRCGDEPRIVQNSRFALSNCIESLCRIYRKG